MKRLEQHGTSPPTTVVHTLLHETRPGPEPPPCHSRVDSHEDSVCKDNDNVLSPCTNDDVPPPLEHRICDDYDGTDDDSDNGNDKNNAPRPTGIGTTTLVAL